MKTIHERDIETHFIKKVKALGGEVRKVKWIGRAHAPDRLALIPTRRIMRTVRVDGRHFFVELKAPGEPLRRGQAREHERLRKAGFEIHVFSTFAGINAFFEGV